MEIIKIINFIMNICIALTTENEWLTNILVIPFYIIEPLVNMLLFTTILKIKYTKKQQFLYIFSVLILGILSGFIIPKPYGTYINMILNFILILVIFKTSIFKSIICELLPIIITVIFETLLFLFYLILIIIL